MFGILVIQIYLSSSLYSLGGSTLETLFLKKNYWRATRTGREIFECPIDNSCKGGSEFSNGGESYCSKGYQGVLCAVCDSEYFFDNEQNTCSKCDDAFKSQSLWTALLVLLLIFVAYMAWNKGLKDETQCFKRIRWKGGADDSRSRSGGNQTPRRLSERASYPEAGYVALKIRV